MVVSDAAIHNIMGGIESTGDVRLHNHRRKLKQRFDIVKKLGQGTYGKVQLGLNKETGQEVAIKTIRKCKIETEADLIRIRREIQIMSSVRHPNIIHIYEVFENREKMVLVMEYAAGGELYDYLSERKVLKEEEARRIFRQIATAIYYCHKHNICHRDLKLENILLDEIGNAKIADFGLSNVFSYSALLSTFCGSPLYASPEIVKGTPYQGPEVDCWSLGVLLYTLVYGAMPFDGSNFKRLVKQISTGNYFEPKNPSPASSLISDMLNVNPARRADITAICSHRWMNETYTELCLDVAEELALQTPVRLDLLLSLTAPAVNAASIVVDANNQVPNAEAVNGVTGRPVRSQSLGSIPPTAVPAPVIPFPVPEIKEKEIVQEEKIPKTKKKERSHSRTRRKERSRSRSTKTDSKESQEDDTKVNDEESNAKAAPLVNSGTQVLGKAHSEEPKEAPSIPVAESAEVGNESKETAEGESKPKPVERRRSKVFEVAEKFNAANEKPVPKVPPPKKIILAGINVDDARKEFERRSSLSSGSNSPPKKNSASMSNVTADEEAFPLASTVALNKLVESAFRDELPFDTKPPSTNELEEDRIAPKLLNSASAEGNGNKAATLPRRKTSRAEIQLITPQLPSDNYKTEVEHFINKPAVNHKTEVVIPVNAPLPPKPLTKQDNQSKEHVIPIQVEQEPPRKTASQSSSWTASKSSIPRTSSSSLSRQSTVESDSGSTISTGEPIRKSPREVIIPIAVEGGGFVTPSEDTLHRMNSMNDSEDESRNGSRCFTLRSTKRRQPERSQTQLDTADSLSSDEDDNFQMLTAENLFSTLLSRVRSLTQRLNNDEMRRSSGFPRSLFTQHSSLFDNIPRSRITETRSFSRPESAPWRRTMSQGQVAQQQPKRDDLMKKRYSNILEERASVPKINAHHEERKPLASVNNKSENEPASPKEATVKAASLPKMNIEDEFDKFFSKYKRPSDPYTEGYSRTSPIAGRASPSISRSTSMLRRANTDDQEKTDEAKVASKPPRRSRFLRPDFYDTPREESKYVIQNEKVRAFRERSLSRQRDLSRNRSNNSLSSGWSSDYLRSKTCSIADKMDSLQRRDFRRTFSEDRTPTGSPKLTRTSSGNDNELESFQTAKRKSLILQNELENEIRKAQNINSKLSGLMVTLNDAENQYEKKLERLYGLKKEKSPNSASRPNEPNLDCKSELKCSSQPKCDKTDQDGRSSADFKYTAKNDVAETSTLDALSKYQPRCDKGEVFIVESRAKGQPTYGKSGTSNLENALSLDRKYNCESNHETASKYQVKCDKTTETSNYDNLSLLDKKYAYFRKLRNSEQVENGATEEASTSATSSCSPEKDAILEDADSDACSMLSDGTDAHYLDNLNDRIRRRSFYSRFNSFNSVPRSRPVSYSRSMSADVGRPQRSSASTKSKRNKGSEKFDSQDK